MATEKWIAGAVASFTTVLTAASTLDSIVNGNAILTDLQLDNSSNLDLFADFDIQFGSITAAAPNFIGLYLYPLNQDASTYGDTRFGSSAAGPPSANYWIGNIGFATGAAAIKGSILRVVLPPAKFKLVMYNQAGATLAGAGGNQIYWRTYNRSIA